MILVNVFFHFLYRHFDVLVHFFVTDKILTDVVNTFTDTVCSIVQTLYTQSSLRS